MVKYIKKTVVRAVKIFMELKLWVKIAMLAGGAGVFMFISIEVTGKTGFCNTCHVMNPFYDSWKVSTHSQVNCLECHLKPGFAGYVKGKINGLAQAVDCVVGRIGTKPNAHIDDLSCLRAQCHSVDELSSETIEYKNVKFKHAKHIGNVVDGIKISCNTCHSHFEGEEHFSINDDVCFTCHFLKSGEKDSKEVRTSCTGCHEVPDKVIERGLVKINHAEFVSYEASCEDSCHKKIVEQPSSVSENICLNCHSFGKDEESDVEKLHAIHSEGEKVECFACHGKVEHGQTGVDTVSAMMDCLNCHSDTHNVQFSTYTAEQYQEHKKMDIVLSPMFLTHVECSGCHIDRQSAKSNGIGSIGTVAKAVPQACDRCHQTGSGEQYISFWQRKTKELHKQVSDKLEKLEDVARFETNKERSVKLKDKIKEAQAIIRSVESDGSWGVHNFKYTEAMLLNAKKIITDAQED